MVASVLMGWCILFGGCGEAKFRCGPAVGAKQLNLEKFQQNPFDKDLGLSVMVRCRMKILPPKKRQEKGLK